MAPSKSTAALIYRCPSARKVDEWRETGLDYPSEWWLNSSYGLNQFAIVSPFGPAKNPRRLSELPVPHAMVFAQDAAEQKMEGPSDSCGLWPGDTECLTQWKYSLASYYPKKMDTEWWRHPTSMVLTAAGNVVPIRYTPVGIDYRHYTGEVPEKFWF
jgi:hypothetical protein